MRKFLLALFVAVVALSSCKKETTDAYTGDDQNQNSTAYQISYSFGGKQTTGLVSNGDTLYCPIGKVLFELIPTANADWTFYTSSWSMLSTAASINEAAYTFSTLGWYYLTVVNPALGINITVVINVNNGVQPVTPQSVRYVGAWYNQNTNEMNYVFRGPKVFLSATQFFQVGDAWNNGFAEVFSGMHMVGADSVDVEIAFSATTAPSLKKFCYGATVLGTNTWVSGCDGLWHTGLSGPGNDLWWFYPSYGTAVPHGGNTATVPGSIPDNNGSVNPDIAPMTISGTNLRIYCFIPPLSYNALIGAGAYNPQFHYKSAPHYDPFPVGAWTTATFTPTSTNKSYYYADLTMPANTTIWFEWSQALTFIPMVNQESLSDSWDIINNCCKVSN